MPSFVTSSFWWILSVSLSSLGDFREREMDPCGTEDTFTSGVKVWCSARDRSSWKLQRDKWLRKERQWQRMSCNLMKASLLPLSTHLQTANDERGLWGDQCQGHRCMHTHTNICKHGVRSLYFQHHIGGSGVKQGEDCSLPVQSPPTFGAARAVTGARIFPRLHSWQEQQI